MDAYPLKWITTSVAVAYAPRSESDLKTIQAAGIRAIVNLKAAGFDVYFIPIVDEAAPGMEALESLLDWMQQQADSGNQMLVHCRYGIGRTGTVVLAFLLYAGYSFTEARAMMKHTPSWPASRDQEAMVDSLMIKLKGISVAGKFPKEGASLASKFFERLQAALKWRE